jgi:cytochrome c oxidase cbb3-type subunit 4
MDGINLVRIIVAVVAFLCFIACVAWAWSAHNRKSFDEAARLPFEGE